MLDYKAIVKELEEKEEYAINKLGIYYELYMTTDTEGCSNEDINEIVNYLHDIYFDNDETDFGYLGFAIAAVRLCNYSLKQILTSIRENGDEFNKQILTEYNAIR